MNSLNDIQHYIDKTMLEDRELYSAVVVYSNSKKDDRSAQTLLWKLSHSNENRAFYLGRFTDFKEALDSMKIKGGGYER